MTKLSPQYQAWRARRADKYATRYDVSPEASFPEVPEYFPAEMDAFLAGAEAEHEAAKLVGAIEAYEDAGVGHPHIFRARNAAQARLDALLRGEEVKDGT